ncbi:neuroligin-4, Y-linked [Tribolium madens]|uniref:neuroligin-4, Y-linked n=1 Tax=Tribolium madens TaxID=41895 RepID=UPI001CF76430|nr:neuroligin-4, Y-linked [Tribolium madens]
MAVIDHLKFKLFIFLCSEFTCCVVLGQYRPNNVYGQHDDRNQFSQYNNPYHTPNPGDRDYRTYVYKGRRYGQQNNFYNNRWRPGDPRIQGQDEHFFYDQQGNGEPILPGVLGGWRTDLQGKFRSQTKDRKRDIFVTTTHGQVQGFLVYLFDNPDPESLYRPGSEFIEREYGATEVYLGIPYAEPPILEGRFKPPRWHKGWQLLQAVDFGPACPQPARYVGATKGVRDMDEDCLYLNVYKPPTSEEGVGKRYPIMVYIHGGDFVRGASNTFPGHIMATFYEVIVVTINYRLGALGFISTGDVNSPGNYGILDQAMALKWIYENAESFNGDRYSITLFGPGAGAASAGLLMVAPQTKDMVSKVIAQSGSALADWTLIVDKYRAQNTSRVFGKLIGCSIESSWKLMNCLKQGRSFYEIGNSEFPPEVGLFPWAPVIEMNVSMPFYEGWQESDWHFLKETPEELIKKRHFNKYLKYMSGITLQEAATFITSNKSLEPNFIIDQEFFDQKVKELVLRYNYTLNPNGTYEAIKYMYTYWPDPNNKTHIRDKYIQMLSDFLYTAPNDKIAKLLVEQGVEVYMYVLNTTIESFKLEEWRKVPHDIEHYLLCGAPFMDTEFFPEGFTRTQWTNNDRNMSHFFMQAYTNFAKYGNPTYTQILGIHFEVAKHGELKYLNLNTTYNSSIMWNFRQTQSAFWSQYLPTVVGHLVPTYPPTTEYWWEPRAPLQIAFWSMSAACLLLVVLLVVCCMLWRNAKRQSDRYIYDPDPDEGVDNTRLTSAYDYADKLRTPISVPPRTNSASTFRTESAVSLKETQGFVSSSPSEDYPRKGTPVLSHRQKSKTELSQGVPQTDV